MNKNTDKTSSWSLLQGLSEPEIEQIFSGSTKRTYRSGDPICKQGDSGESMFMVLAGRVRMSVHRDGKEELLNVLGPGSHFGEVTLLIGGLRTATATAIMDTSVLEISQSQFQSLVSSVPAFSVNLTRTIAGWLRGELTGKTPRQKIAIAAIVRTSESGSSFARQLTDWVNQRNRRVEVFTDRPEAWRANELLSIQSISPQSGSDEQAILHIGLTGAASNFDHVVVDIDVKKTNADTLAQCERVWWIADQNDPKNSSLDKLRGFLREENSLRKRTQVVWVQRNETTPAAHVDANVDVHHRFQRCSYSGSDFTIRDNDIARFYHMLRGVHLGLALGGGGARGLAHMGVLTALEENGLYFDRVAGTSAGAIIAGGYAADLGLKEMLAMFNKEMTPPKWVKMMPKGPKWHLMTLFRFGWVEQRFRRHLKDTTFEEVMFPIHMISVDLIKGEGVIRQDGDGDIVSSIMESINHPIFGKPIMREGQALVDGGVLINVPSSVLRQAHADYVLAVDVGTKLPPSFGGNTSESKLSEMKKVGYLQTLVRVLDVSQRGLVDLHMAESDFLIDPDTSSCPFEDFTKGEELWEIGYNKAMELMPELKESVNSFVERD